MASAFTVGQVFDLKGRVGLVVIGLVTRGNIRIGDVLRFEGTHERIAVRSIEILYRPDREREATLVLSRDSRRPVAGDVLVGADT